MRPAEAHPWIPDCGDGTYRNPVLHSDYSDPDVIRHGGDFWMVASSFQCAPGLPILRSRDLVNWRLVNHAIRRVPHPRYEAVCAGCGVWAPAIRFHAGKFWIFFPMPDEGIFVATADHPAGEWEEPWLLCEAKGWIDPCPFWDDDGRAYLVHAYANSRAGLKERIHLRPMTPDGRSLLGGDVELFHTPHHPYLEGPKVHKINGWYYILCPGGGVPQGWQVAFRSRDLRGPYEEKVVLEQGSTDINGPHQGALVDLDDGSWWFLHFQDRGPFGRVVHLQPVRWVDDWPMMGQDHDGNGVGEPVPSWIKPLPGAPVEVPATNDAFSSPALGRQWQWHANWRPDWYSLSARPGWLRLYGGTSESMEISRFPQFLGQKFPAREFSARTSLDFSGAVSGSTAGLAVVSGDGARFVGLRARDGAFDLVLGGPECVEVVSPGVPACAEFLVTVDRDARFVFWFGFGGAADQRVPGRFLAKSGGWIGAKVGLFHRAVHPGNPGSADFSSFRFGPPLRIPETQCSEIS